MEFQIQWFVLIKELGCLFFSLLKQQFIMLTWSKNIHDIISCTEISGKQCLKTAWHSLKATKQQTNSTIFYLTTRRN